MPRQYNIKALKKSRNYNTSNESYFGNILACFVTYVLDICVATSVFLFYCVCVCVCN